MPPNDLSVVVQNDKSLRAQLLELYPALVDDSSALLDTLDGISDFNEAVVIALRIALEREAMAEGVAGLIAKMGERKARLSQGAENIRALVLNAMQEAGREKIAAADMTVSVSAGRPGVQIIDEALLPEDCVVLTRKANLKAIGEAMKAGQDVPGAAPKNPRPFLTVRVS